MAKKKTKKATVISITDGDTFKVTRRGSERVIRIACIDTPEMSPPPWGQAAKDVLTGIMRVGGKVKIKELDNDRYGRVVAEVFKGSMNIGEELVRKGYAFVYDDYAYQCNAKKLNRLQRKAKRNERGIWGRRNEGHGKTNSLDSDILSTEIVNNHIVPPYEGSRLVTCSQISSQREANEWLLLGHTYLDADRDGFACESLPLT